MIPRTVHALDQLRALLYEQEVPLTPKQVSLLWPPGQCYRRGCWLMPLARYSMEGEHHEHAITAGTLVPLLRILEELGEVQAWRSHGGQTAYYLVGPVRERMMDAILDLHALDSSAEVPLDDPESDAQPPAG